MGHAGFDRLLRHFAAVAVEQGKLAARLRQAARQIAALRLGGPGFGRAGRGCIGGRGLKIARTALAW